MSVESVGLPKHFLSSLKILFDILDENRSGLIRLRDIESRWSDDGVRGLPPGVIDSLRKVAPSNGLLTFEKFVSGLKLTLAKKQREIDRQPFSSKENQAPEKRFEPNEWKSNHRLYSSNQQWRSNEPQKEIESNYPSFNSQNNSSRISEADLNYKTFAGRKHVPHRNVESQLQETTNYLKSQKIDRVGGNQDMRRPSVNYSQLEKPPNIPPRSSRMATNYNNYPLKKSLSGPEILSYNSPPAVPPRENRPLVSNNWKQDYALKQGRLVPNIDPHAIYANIEEFQRKSDLQGRPKATVKRHGSGRRHTLADGIDQNMLKRMKQLEEEMSVLQSGLTMIETARDWYRQQITAVSEKQSMLGKVAYMDNSLESYEERLTFQRARISEVNQHLRTLLESSEKGFPLHMNLALSRTSNKRVSHDDNSLGRTQDNQRNLQEELKERKDQIHQLEKEKASLVRDLFEARSKHKANFDDTTFM